MFELGEHHVTPESDVLFAVLLLLTSKAGHPVPRAELLELLWPESDENSARHRLRQAVYQLKKLGAPLDTPESAIVVRKSDVEVDYVVCRHDREALAAFVSEPQHLEVLPRYAPGFSKPFARWVEGERDRVRTSLRFQLLSSVAAHRARADHDNAIVFARACVELAPFDEDAVFALAESLAIRGRATESLRVLDQHRDALRTLAESQPRRLIHLRERIVAATKRTSRPLSDRGDLVGRGSIVQQIDAWTSMRPRTRPVLAFVGEAGIGKTRLVGEAARIAAINGVRFLDYRPNANGQNRSLVGMLDLVPQLLSLPGAVGCQPESYGRLTELARGVHQASSLPANTAESGFGFALVRRAVLDLVEAILAEGELILSIDDAHTLDAPTLDILLDATRLPGRSLALILALRPDAAAVSVLGTHFQVIRVPRLQPDEGRLLLTRNITSTLTAPRREMIDWALDLAHGNPFFLTELSAHCCSDEAFAVLPQSLHNALEQRLEVLTPTARLVLEACAMLGQNATLARVEMVLGLPPHSMSAALSELDNASLLSTRDGWVGCRHDLICEVVLAAIGTPLGVYLHRRCAAVLDRALESSPFASLAWDCAEHWAAADERSRALELTELIVDRLLALGMAEAAADLCHKAEQYCRTAHETAERLRKLGYAHRLLHDWNTVVAVLEKRNRLVDHDVLAADKYEQEQVMLLEARWWGKLDLRVLTSAMTRASDARAPAAHRLQMGVLALIVADNANRRRQASHLFSILERIVPLTPRDEVEQARAKTIYHCSFGNLDVAIDAASRVVQLERGSANGANLIRPLRWLAKPLILSGNRRGAVDALTESFTIASNLSLRSEMLQTAFCLKDIAIDCEDLQLARDWMPICEGLDRDVSNGYSRAANALYLMARIALIEGNLSESKSLLLRAQSVLGTERLTRAEESILALDVLLRLRTEGKVTKRAVNKLHRLHLGTRESGFRDFELGALLAGLVHLGELGLARTLSREYGGVRRSRLPLHSVLVAARQLL